MTSQPLISYLLERHRAGMQRPGDGVLCALWGDRKKDLIDHCFHPGHRNGTMISPGVHRQSTVGGKVALRPGESGNRPVDPECIYRITRYQDRLSEQGTTRVVASPPITVRQKPELRSPPEGLVSDPATWNHPMRRKEKERCKEMIEVPEEAKREGRERDCGPCRGACEGQGSEEATGKASRPESREAPSG